MSGKFIRDIIIEKGDNTSNCRDLIKEHLKKAKEGDFVIFKTSKGEYQGIVRVGFMTNQIQMNGQTFQDLDLELDVDNDKGVTFSSTFRKFQLQPGQLNKYALNQSSGQKALLQDIQKVLIHTLALDCDLTLRNGHGYYYGGTTPIGIRNKDSIIPLLEKAHQHGIWMPIVSRSTGSDIKKFMDKTVEENSDMGILHKLTNSVEDYNDFVPCDGEKFDVKTWLIGHLINTHFPHTSKQNEILDLNGPGLVVSCTLLDDTLEEGTLPITKGIQFIHANVEQDNFDFHNELVNDNPGDKYLAELAAEIQKHNPMLQTFEIVEAQTFGLKENEHFYSDIGNKVNKVIEVLNSHIKNGKDFTAGDYEDTLKEVVENFGKVSKAQIEQIRALNSNSQTFFVSSNNAKTSELELVDPYVQQLQNVFSPFITLALEKINQGEDDWQASEEQWKNLMTTAISVVTKAKEGWEKQRGNVSGTQSTTSNTNSNNNNEVIMNPNKMEVQF